MTAKPFTVALGAAVFAAAVSAGALAPAPRAHAQSGSDDNCDNRRTGQIVGGILGAVVGNRLGGDGDTGRILGTVAGAGIGVWVGGKVACGLSDRGDRERVAESTRRAAETGQSQTWRNDRTGAYGRAEIVGNESRPTPTDIQVAPGVGLARERVTPDGRDFRATRTANVRSAPVNGAVVNSLAPNTGLKVIGRVQGKPWSLVGSGDGVALGYVSNGLIAPGAGSTAPNVPEGRYDTATVDVLVQCRIIRQTATERNGRTQTGEVTACRQGDQWVLV